MTDLLKEIAEWHKNTFDTTKEEQLIKLKEEIQEYHEAENFDDIVNEMADVMIVVAALVYRYEDESYHNIMMNAIDENKISQKILYDAIKTKFEKNKRRKWEKQPDGTYHHV